MSSSMNSLAGPVKQETTLVDFLYHRPPGGCPNDLIKVYCAPRGVNCRLRGEQRNWVWRVDKQGETISENVCLEKCIRIAWEKLVKTSYHPSNEVCFRSRREENEKFLQDLLYDDPPLGSPNEAIKVCCKFEEGGANDDWGFVIERNGKMLAACRHYNLSGCINSVRRLLNQT